MDEGETIKEFEEAERVVTVDAGEIKSLLVLSLVLDVDRFEAGDTLSGDEDKVRLLVELGLDSLLSDFVVLS